jgi:uncharacterized protein YggE
MVKSVVALGALMLSGAALAAPESLMKVDTAKGEILLEVQGVGSSVAKIASISTACDLRTSGRNKGEARKQLIKAQDAMKAAFKANGLGTAKLDFSALPTNNAFDGYPVPIAIAAEPQTEAVMAGDAAKEAAAAVGDAAAAAAADPRYDTMPVPREPWVDINQRVRVTLASAADLDMAQAVMGDSSCQEDYSMTRRPDILLADAAGAKAKATAMAISAAKAQAESYAAALGMKVVGMIRISEIGAIKEFLGAESDALMQEMRGNRDRNKPLTNDVPVSASIAVDFVLGPK